MPLQDLTPEKGVQEGGGVVLQLCCRTSSKKLLCFLPFLGNNPGAPLDDD